MSKRKYENDKENSSKKSKQETTASVDTEPKSDRKPENETKSAMAVKRHVTGIFDIKQFRKEIVGKQGQNMALTQFLQVCLNPDSNVDYVLEYLNCGGNSHEILRQINSDNKKNLTLATPAFHLFHLIILKVQSSVPHMIPITEEACRYFLNNFMSTVEIMISESSGPRHRKIVLKLLTSMVTLNSDLGIEVLNQVPLTHTKLKHIVEINHKEKDNVRNAFILFLTSFLLDGHLPLIKALLEKTGLLGLILPGLVEDDAESVLMFLNILKNHVVDNTFISKTLKIGTFNQGVLHNMFKLYSWRGPPDTSYEVKNQARLEITAILSDILLTLFTNHKIGLYFMDHSFGTTELNKNPVLYKALLSLNRPWENEARGDLILQIICKCPDLHRAVISIIEKSFEPQNTRIWEKTIEYTVKVLETMKPEDVLARASTLNPYQIANIVRFMTLPVPLLKHIQASQDTDQTISLYCLRVLVTMLQSLKRYIQLLEQQEFATCVNELRNKLDYVFSKHMPLPTAIAVLINNTIDLKADRTKTLSQDYNIPKVNNTDALISLIDLLLLYHSIHPSFFETLDGNIDMKHILDYSVTLTEGPVSVLKFKVVSLWLTLDRSAISLKNPIFKDLFLIMLDVYMSDDEHIWLEAKETLRSFFQNTMIFEADEDEIHLILYTLRSSKVNPPSLVGDIVEYVLENIQELTDYVRNQLVNFEISDENAASSLHKLFNDLMENRHAEDCAFLENKVSSPFIVGCMQYLQLNKDKKKSLKQFLSQYIANLLHSNYSPELTEVLIGDSKLEARDYVASWIGQPVSLPEAIVGNDAVLKNISKSIIDNEELRLEEVFPFINEVENDEKDFLVNKIAYKLNLDRNIDSSELLAWAKYLIFCTVRLTDMGLLKQEQQQKITAYIQCVIAIGRKVLMVDVCRTIILNLFKNPHVLKTYKCLDQKKGESNLLATHFLLDIIIEHKDIIDNLHNKHKLLKLYQQKNYSEIVKGFVKIKKGKEINGEFTMKVLEIVGLAVEDDLRVFNLIFGAEVANCIREDKEPSLILELLKYLIDKYSKSASLELQSQTLRKCMKLYTELLTNKEVNANLTQLEVALTEYFEHKPHQVKTISDDLFKKFFEANIVRKSTPQLAAVLLKHNVKLSNTFKQQIIKPEILSHRELTLPLGNAVLNHHQFLLENKELLATIYNEYKSNIAKMLEKPHKAGQVYISNSGFIRKLVLECMNLQECEKLFAKSHKFEAVELSHVHLFQSIFLKLCSSDNLKKEYLTNYLLSMLHIISLAIKEGIDSTTIEVVTNIYNVVKLSKYLGVCAQNDDFKKVTESAIWQHFCKAVLKDSLKLQTVVQTSNIGPQLMCLLTNLVKLFYTENHDDIATLFDMITSHSEFLNLMLSYRSSEIKSRLIELLYTLIRSNKSVMKAQQIPVYLSSYHATRSHCDRLILAILYQYESNGLPVNEYKPYIWGDSGANYYSVRKNRSSSLWGHPTANQILGLFEKEIIDRTVRNFPVMQKLDYHHELPSNIDGIDTNIVHTIESMCKDGAFRSAGVKDTEAAVRALALRAKYHEAMEAVKAVDVGSVSQAADDSGIYDPVFLFPLLSHLLAPGSVASCFKMLRSGLLGVPLAALAARCPAVRAAACHVLHRFCMLLETETRHKNDKLFLNDFISTLRHSISSAQNNADSPPCRFLDGSNPRIPSIDALYLARGLMVSTAPFDPLYKPINNFLIAKQFVDLTVVPDFLSLFHDSDVESSDRRLWVLDIIKDGTKTMSDVNVIFKTMCLKMIMDYYTSVLGDKKAREKVLAMLSSIVMVPRAMEILTEGYGLVSWLHSVSRQIKKEEKSLFRGVVTVLRSMLSSLKVSAFAKSLAAKGFAKTGKPSDFVELKINKDVENEILVILYDSLRNIEIFEVRDATLYMNVFNLLTKRAVKCLTKAQMVNLVNKIGAICQDDDRVRLLSRALGSNDMAILKSAHLVLGEECLLRDLTSVVQTYVV